MRGVGLQSVIVVLLVHTHLPFWHYFVSYLFIVAPIVWALKIHASTTAEFRAKTWYQ